MSPDPRIQAIVSALKEARLTGWEKMPDIELYMDQVITYLKRQLALFQGASDPSLVTPSIINNYVKDGILARPVKKRYAQHQLAALTMACILKRVLPMQRVKQFTAPAGQQVEQQDYEAFRRALEEVLAGEADHLDQVARQTSLEDMALSFAMRASVDCLIADRLLALIRDGQAGPAS